MLKRPLAMNKEFNETIDMLSRKEQLASNAANWLRTTGNLQQFCLDTGWRLPGFKESK